MAITTLAGAVSGAKQTQYYTKAAFGSPVSNRPMTWFYSGGYPPAAAAPSPGIGGEVLTTYAGQLPFSNPVSGNSYLSYFKGTGTVAGVPGMIWVCDRLWQNSGIDITSTAEQTFTSSAQIPARDRDGTNTGNGVYAAVEVSAVVGAGTPNLTLKYTNQAGTADQTSVNIFATAATPAVGSWFPMGLAAGDTGIQKAQSLTLSQSWTSGTIHVVLYRIIACISIQFAGLANAIDPINGCMQRMYDNSVPFLVYFPFTTTAVTFNGQMTVAQG